MIDDIEKKQRICSTSEMLFKKQVLLEVSYFARNIYEIETVTSRLRYLETQLS